MHGLPSRRRLTKYGSVRDIENRLTGQIPLRKALPWSKVRVETLGLLDTSPEDFDRIGGEFVVLGDDENFDTFMRDPETGRRIKGFKVWSEASGVCLLGGDTKVTETVSRRPAAHPEAVASRAIDGQVIVKSTGDVIRWQGETHPFIWECAELDTAVDGTTDSESGLETLLYAIPVAPEEILPVLHAAFARSYDDVLDYYETFNDPLPRWDQDGYKLTTT